MKQHKVRYPATGMFASAIPIVAMFAAMPANAQNAVNTATVTAPTGAFEINAANNAATDSDTIFAAIVASDDVVGGINGLTGGTAVVNAFTSDTVNGVAASPLNAVLSLAAGSSVPAGLSFDTATGNVDVAAGTPAGTYSFEYQLCEALNPTNCRTARITVTVVAAAIAADADAVAGINGASGAADVLDVLEGDTLNGVQVTLSQVDLTVTTPATPVAAGAPVPVLDVATGLVSVPSGTPAGTYSITYQICETLNPANCASNTATITVAAAAIVASDDVVGGINGLTGGTAVVNAFTSDTVNGVAASPLNAVLSLAAGSSVPAGLSFDTATGNVDVAAGTPAGTYSFEYQLCEALNPTNCRTARITVTVVAAAIAADADAVAGINGASGAADVLDVLEGDTLNGVQVTLSQVDLTVTTPATPVAAGAPVPVLDVATGLVSVPSGTPAGTYSITYQICETLNPANCASNTATITVAAAAIVASDDVVGGINGLTGGTAVVNAFTSDTVNGVAASPLNAVLSLAAGSSVPAGLSFDTATGNVDVAAGTPAGTYSFEYQLCEALNPTNCRTARITVTVVAAAIAADADAVAGINGASGAADVLDVLEGDTLNGVQVTLSQVDLTVTTPATPVAAGAPVPVLDVATGLVSVPSGTPAGTYSITYQICETLNPANCASNTATITVAAAAIVASDDVVGGINGLTGGTAVVNAFTSDTVNGVAASPLNAVLSLAAGSSVPAGLSFDTATGNVDVAAGTPAGTYSFEYQLCEALNPTNCRTARITVTVVAAAIAADADAVAGINGASGAADVLDVLEGDTLNGVQVTLSQVDLTVTTPATPVAAGAPVPVLDVATGLVSVPSGTPAGTYSITYQICETLNPANCASNTATITVAAAAIVASDDVVGGINGLTGGTAVVNAFTSDTVNGVAASPLNAVLSLAAGSSVPAGLSFDTATGNVDVAAGTPAGTYSFEYQLCEALNPTNCRTARITVTVVAAAIAADADAVAGINGASGAADVLDVLEGDTLNGVQVTLSQVDLTVTTPATPVAAGAPVPVLDVATGLVSVPSGTPAGTYSITYQICETLNPANCASNTATITVAAAAIVASDDVVGGINGLTGGTAVVNAFTSDTVNGVAASPLNAVLSLAAGSSVPAGLSFDTATGNVDVAAGTPAGTYSFEYQLCEALNPTNCRTARITVTVVAAAIAADADAVAGINGASGAADVLDVLEGDTLNGVQVTLSQVDLTVTTPATPVAAGAPVPVLDVATGLVSVPSGTPAGTYSITYQICETLNPANCASNTATITVAAAAIVASDDVVGGINGLTGGTAVVNAFTSDTVNGVAASPLNAVLSLAAGSSVPAGLSFDTATGNVDVAAGTPAGTYSFEYQLCEALNPTNCRTARITVTVVAAAIAADADAVAGINGASGAADVLDVLEGDTLNGVQVTLSQVDLTVTTPATPVAAGAPVPVLDVATGLVSVPSGTPAGTYSITYQICETLNPANCASNTATITVAAAAIVADADLVSGIVSGIGNPNLLNVLSNDSLNGAAINPAAVAISIITPAGHPGISLDASSGIVSVGPDVSAGTYVLEYQICEILNPGNCARNTVTVVVESALSNVTGTVYTDMNGNRLIDNGDLRRGGWIVELVRNGVVVGTTRSDEQGEFSFTGMLSGDGYEIRFRNPQTNVVFGIIRDLSLAANTTMVEQNLPIDPSGVIYDSITRAPVAGVVARLLDGNGNALPTACFLDPSQQAQSTGTSGEYRFDIIPGAASQCPVGENIYQIALTPPVGYSFISTVLLPQPGPLDPTGLGSPYQVASNVTAPVDANPVYYLSFRLASGDPDVTNNHIPVDPFLTRTPLVVTKTSTKRSASTGDLVPYEITVRNAEGAQRAGVTVVDILPPGMKYVTGSASIDGVPVEPVVTDRQLLWQGQVIPANGAVRYNLVLTVGAGVTNGEKVNTGLAQNLTGTAISNRGTAVVSIVPSAVFDCSELLGKVFEDRNRNGYQDDGEPGVPGVRLATVNGQLVTTDQYGRYHIACAAVPDARLGSNYVLKLDPRTLPLGWGVTTDNPRSIRLTRGKFGELNFGVAPLSNEAVTTNRHGPGEK